MRNVVEAVARSKPAEYKPMFDGAAVVSLTPTSDCNNVKSFWVHAEQTLSIYDAGVFVNSHNPDCALIQQANGSIRIHGDYPIQVVGGWQISKPSLLTPYPPVHVAGVQYPPPFYMPEVSCTQDATISEDLIDDDPRKLERSVPAGGRHQPRERHLLPGRGLQHGQWQPDRKRRAVPDGKRADAHLRRRACSTCSGRQSGKLKGLLVYQPMENKHPVVLNAAVGSEFSGTVLAPGAQILIKGNDTTSGFHSQMVGYTIEADGNSNVIIRYNDAENYDALYWPEVQFAK